jgi:bacterioferritin (cytochrome b1)
MGDVALGLVTGAIALAPEGDAAEAPWGGFAEGDSLQGLVQRWQRVREQVRRPPARQRADRQRLIVLLLSDTLALTLLSACRYRKRALTDAALTADYLRYAHEAQCMAAEIAAYIRTLRAAPSFRPIHLSPGLRAPAQEDTLADLVTEDLIAARIAVRSCREVVACLEPRDRRRTRDLFDALLAIEQEHVAGLTELHERLRAAGGQRGQGGDAHAARGAITG